MGSGGVEESNGAAVADGWASQVHGVADGAPSDASTGGGVMSCGSRRGNVDRSLPAEICRSSVEKEDECVIMEHVRRPATGKAARGRHTVDLAAPSAAPCGWQEASAAGGKGWLVRAGAPSRDASPAARRE